MAFSSSPLATAYPWLHRLPPRAPEEASWRHAGGCTGAWVQSGSGPPASTLSGSSSCRVRKLVAHRTLPGRAVHRGKFLEVPWLAFPASSSCRGLVSSRQDPLAGALSLPGKILLPGPCLFILNALFLKGLQGNPRRTLAVVRQALPRGAATAHAQVRDTKVPLL